MRAGLFVFHPRCEKGEVLMDQETLIERLMAENGEFRRLREEHRHHDGELEGLANVPALG